MSNFVMTPEDELMHAPDAAVNFNESAYTNAFDSKQRVGGWMRLGNRVNEGYAELSVCLYLPDGRIACQFKRPKIAHNNAFDAGGLKYSVLEPLSRVAMDYTGELIIVENPEELRDPQQLFQTGPKVEGHARWVHEAVSPVHGGEPANDSVQTMYGRDFSRGHFNLHSRARGEIRVGSQTWPIDGFGWRDHSWGPRYWQAIYYYRLFIANFANGDGFMLLKITDQQGRSRRQGVLLVDGDYEEIVDLDIMTEWTQKRDPVRVHLGVRTDKRKALITGTIIRLAPLRNRRKTDDEVLVSRIAEGYTAWEWDGRQGYGMTEYIERLEEEELAGYPL
jgi:hypothetical protein